ncbi:non-ribosomal peptide synthetase [Amycolatopsis alba]|uniref:Carrier domain-containing protein n=1 Tax=Amycolatopsis alba DSM 44262 TaxID=1125972 RepID=A0A229RL33_AMYAL|nr:non-ribosomal peptide synthetase [Amycolatopsis alba]OXM47357.1 hypothetical protein CFP75_24265 [Amycolatopsis alba DSM 44262]
MKQSTITEEFKARANDRPSAVAVRQRGSCLTYAELDHESDMLAIALRDAGVAQETPVGLQQNLSADFVISVLAVLKAGGCYVPVNPADPAARRTAVLAGVDAQIVLTDGANALHAAESGLPTLLAEDKGHAAQSPDPTPVTTESLAYIMHTSGSTGKPKPVGITHRAVVSFGRCAVWRNKAHRRVLLHSPTSFDASTYELWVPLLNGWEIVVPGDSFDTMDPEALTRVIAEFDVTGVFLTSALFAALAEVQPDCLSGAKEVWFGGEAASAFAVREVLKRCPNLVLVNGYGPTETTTFATFHRLSSERPVPERIPIGTAMPDMSTMVLDDTLSPVGEGADGELYLSGSGLARGYLGRSGITAERFVANPFGPPGSRMYRTGDRVRSGPGGLEFLGRSDDMVKIRGFRIELGEIDNALTRIPKVAQAVTVVKVEKNGYTRLVSYVTRNNAVRLDIDDVRTSVEKYLPSYMLPGRIVEVDKLPLTSNGKVDRGALAEWEVCHTDKSTTTKPWTDLEKNVAEIWEEILGCPPAGVESRFLEDGGDSLKAMLLTHRIRQRCHSTLSVRTVLEAQTLKELLACVEAGRQAATGVPVPVPDRDSTPEPSVGQQGILLFGKIAPTSVLYNVPLVLDVPQKLDAVTLQEALNDVAQRHEPLRTTHPMSPEGKFRSVINASIVPLRSDTIPASELESEIRKAVRSEFDLAHELPVRALLLHIGRRRSVLLLLVHHVACDGASIVPLFHDLGVAYRARHVGRAPGLPLPVLRYNDFTRWEKLNLAQTAGLFKEQLAFWRHSLAGLREELPLPADSPRPAWPAYGGGLVSMELPQQSHQAASALAREERCSLFVILQAALAVVLTGYGAGHDIPIGTVTARRPDAAWIDLVGFFANTLVLRVDTSGAPTFRGLVRRTRDVVLGALENQDVPFGAVVEMINPPRHIGRHPLFQVAANLHDRSWSNIEFNGDRSEISVADNGTAKFDLQFDFIVTELGRLCCKLEYSESLFNKGTARRILDSFRGVLGAAVRYPEVKIENLFLDEGV